MPERAPAKPLLGRARTRLQVAAACAAVLSIGWRLAPGARAPEQVPEERPAPMLEQQVEAATPRRLLERIRETGTAALPATIWLDAPAPAPAPGPEADFARAPAPPWPAGASGLVVSPEGEVLTHVAGLRGSLSATLRLAGEESPRAAQVAAYEPATGLVLLVLEGPPPTVATLAAAAAPAGELAKPVGGVVLAAVILFEVVGPLLARRALIATGEVQTTPAPLDEAEPDLE